MWQLIDRILHEIGLEKDLGEHQEQVFHLKSIEEIKKLIIAQFQA
ncbi:hypothetical protein [Zhaonella formicivorans]|jgi:hypothetical protein|nr:hypothetical protein [Zhaonella formicivorans]